MGTQIENQIDMAPKSWQPFLAEFDQSLKTGIGTARKVRASTRHFYIKTLSRYARVSGAEIDTLTMKQLKEYIATVENQSTQRNLCLTLKKFLRYAGRKELSDQISLTPIRLSERKDKIDRITPQEVKQMLKAEDSARNRALIAVFYESAGRLSEIINLKVKDVEPDKYGFIIKLFGKTELRNIRLVASAPYLTTWLNLHAFRNDPEAPLFYSQQSGANQTPTHIGKTITARIIKHAARKAGFKNLGKFHPHAFRHGRLSELGHSMTDSELKYLGGWNDEARRMVSLYAHMDADRVNGKLLNLAGLVPEEEQRQSELSVSPCPRCNALNPEGQEFCGTCGLPLTSEGLEQFKHKTSEIEELRVKIESIENSRESLTLLLKKVLELEKKLNEQKTA